MAETSPRKLTAILAADIAGYSALMSLDEARTVSDLKANQAVILPILSKFHGRLIDTAGDGILAEFASAVNAVECAVAIQDKMTERNAKLEPDRRMMFRIGVNVGDVIYDEARIYGDGVNIAARLESITNPGGVYVSRQVHEQVEGKLALSFRGLGPQTLKNIARPVEVFAIEGMGQVQNESGTAKGSGSNTEHVTAEKPRDIVTPLTDKPSIAVLPFDNVSGDAEQDFIGDGLASDVIATLSRGRSFFVIARNSTFQYKGTSPDVRQVAKDLNVRYVVEGNVRKVGDRLRISVQLIDGNTGHSLWSERYDRDFKDLFEVQDELTLAIVSQLQPELSSAEYDRAKARGPDELDAWELYHRGMHFLQRLTPDDQVEPRRFFEASIERDPNFAPAHAAISYLNWMSIFYGKVVDVDFEKAVIAGKRAIELDDRDARGHFSLAMAYLFNRNHDAAIHEAKVALELNPSFAAAYYALACCFVHVGRAEEALSLLDVAFVLSPRDPEIGLYLSRKAQANLYLERHDEAVALSHKALRHRAVWPHYAILISALGHLNRVEEARSTIDQLISMKPEASVNLVERVFPTVHRPYMDVFLEGLRKAGLREHSPTPHDRS